MQSLLLSPKGLHIPDGFLNLPVALFFWLLSAILIGIAVRRSGAEYDEGRIPLMGIMAAFIFAGQMINFPIAGGTSGHLLGGVLAAVTLGPWSGMLVMTTVIGVQALIFQDGGLLAMGTNIFNMGLLTVAIGYGLQGLVAGRSPRTRLAGAAFAAWLSVIAGAFLTSLQLWLSGIAALSVVLPVMLGVHALIGIGEALITAAALAFIRRSRPGILHEDGQPAGRRWIAAGVLISLAVLVAAPLASANPDGLERVAADLGFLDAARGASFDILPNYHIPSLGAGGVSTIAAGLAGIAIVALVILGLGRVRRGRGGRS